MKIMNITFYPIQMVFTIVLFIVNPLKSIPWILLPFIVSPIIYMYIYKKDAKNPQYTKNSTISQGILVIVGGVIVVIAAIAGLIALFSGLNQFFNSI